MAFASFNIIIAPECEDDDTRMLAPHRILASPVIRRMHRVGNQHSHHTTMGATRFQSRGAKTDHLSNRISPRFFRWDPDEQPRFQLISYCLSAS